MKTQKKYVFSFHGRRSGAIGIDYDIEQEYMAGCLEEACTMLWKDYEHMRNVELNGKKFKFESNHLNHPISKSYKGLGMARK